MEIGVVDFMPSQRKFTAKINLKRVSRIIVYEDFQSAPIPASEKTPLRECLEHPVDRHEATDEVCLRSVSITVNFIPSLTPRGFKNLRASMFWRHSALILDNSGVMIAPSI